MVVNSPGRAEIIGNHTDYNSGYALSCAILQSTVGLFHLRDDKKIIIRSTVKAFAGQIVEFDFNDLIRDEKMKWGNYVKAVVRELLTAGYKINGAEILVDTNFSSSGGLSSSAAFELCLARGLIELSQLVFEPEKVATICQQAENSSLVQSPCGFLDQATIALAKKDHLVFLDFRAPITTNLIPLHLENASFVVVVDRDVKRILGESGYPARRKMCESACKIFGITSLREMSVTEFEQKKDQLEIVMRNRVEHIVYENQRVLDAVEDLKNKDLIAFGRLLTESGRSALDLYQLDENTPELRFLVETGQEINGVLGFRNMGGGFSAIALGLVNDDQWNNFEEELDKKYFDQYHRHLEYIKFCPEQGVEKV